MEAYIIDLSAMGQRIRTLRLSKKKTQESFAESIHISTSYLALIEQGKRTASLDIIASIAVNCSVSVDYLLFGEPAEKTSCNQKTFDTLCRQFSECEIEQALILTKFYLNLEKMRK